MNGFLFSNGLPIRRWVSELQAVLLLMTFFGSSDIYACSLAPKDFGASPREMVNAALQVFVGEFIGTRTESSGQTLDFVMVRDLLSDSKAGALRTVRVPSRNFVTQLPLGSLLSNFEQHQDAMFWRAPPQYTALLPDCRLSLALKPGSRYLVIAGDPLARRSFVPVHSEKDLWLQLVRAHVEVRHGRPSDFPTLSFDNYVGSIGAGMIVQCTASMESRPQPYVAALAGRTRGARRWIRKLSYEYFVGTGFRCPGNGVLVVALPLKSDSPAYDVYPLNGDIADLSRFEGSIGIALSEGTAIPIQAVLRSFRFVTVHPESGIRLAE